MKSLHVLSQKPDFTGSGFYLRALLSEASQAGHEVAVVAGLTRQGSPDISPLYPVLFETDELPFSVVGMSDVMPYRSTSWSDLSEAQLARYRAAFSQVITRAVEEFQPEVIHCHHLWITTALVRELFPTRRIVASCHGTGLRQQLKLPRLAEELSPTLARLDHVYFLTQSQLESSRHDKTRASVVGAGFDPEVFYPNISKESALPRVLYAGKLSFSKGLRELLQAARPDQDRLYRLSLAGSGHGAETEQLVEAAKALGVELPGRLSQQALATLMRRSEVFVLPSYYEGLPLVLAEALACGCKVVVNRLPGLENWLWPPLIQSGWVKLIDMPVLADADQPEMNSIADYVERLRKGIRDQLLNRSAPPPELPDFLHSNSWSGVYRRILAKYKEAQAG